MKNLLMGIDIGTSALKVSLFSTDGKALASASSGYRVHSPKPMYAEQNPMDWWKAACEAIHECFDKSAASAPDIAAIGVCGQSWSAIPMDKNGKVLAATPIWMDRRAKDICDRAARNTDMDSIFDVCGNPFKPMYSLPKIIWMKENMPGVYKKANVFLQSNSFIVYMLTEKYTQDKSQGYGYAFYDIKKNAYDEKTADMLGVPLSLFPGVKDCHEVVGEVTADAARMTGLKKGTPVVAGALDAACGALGAGVYLNGQTQEQGGQAGGMSICLDRPIKHEKLILGSHAVPGMWLLQGGTVAGGAALRWFKQEILDGMRADNGADDSSGFEALSGMAQDVPPGAEGLIFLPYLAGERSPIWDENAKGVFFGLTFDKKLKHMVRAVMEGVAFSLMHNIETAAEAGAEIGSMNSMGGSANSEVWTQIKADVTGITINVNSSDTATGWGAAVLAGMGAGVFKSFDEAVENSIRTKRSHRPDMDNHKIYMKQYKIYRQLYEKLKDTMVKI